MAPTGRSTLLWLALGLGAASGQQKENELDLARSTVPALPAARLWNEPFDPLSIRGKFIFESYSVLGPWSVARTAMSAGIDQWQNDPEEWGGGAGAYGRRLTSRMGERAARHMIRFGIGTLRHEDPRYFRSGQTGAWRRIRNQLAQTVVTRKDDGTTTVAAGRLIGVFGSAQLAQAWMPDTRDGVKFNLRRSGQFLAGDLGLRLLREFWPDIKSRVFRKK